MKATLREQLAALEHEQWMAWSQDIAKTETMTPERLARWQELWKPYDTLTEAQKDQDRVWADQVMECLIRYLFTPQDIPIAPALQPADIREIAQLLKTQIGQSMQAIRARRQPQ